MSHDPTPRATAGRRLFAAALGLTGIIAGVAILWFAPPAVWWLQRVFWVMGAVFVFGGGLLVLAAARGRAEELRELSPADAAKVGCGQFVGEAVVTAIAAALCCLWRALM